MAEAFPAFRGPDETYLERRVRQEVDAALLCDDAKAAAAHVELANRYLVELNSAAAASGAARREA